MTETKRFLFDVSKSFISSIVALFTGFFITVLLGKYLGAEELGLYRMSYTVYGIVLMFASLGFPAAITKYVAQNQKNKKKISQILSVSILISVFMGILLIILFFIASNYISFVFNMPNLRILLRVFSLAFPFALLNSMMFGFLNGMRKLKEYSIAMITQNTLIFLFTLPLVYYGLKSLGVAIGVIFSSVITFFILSYFNREYIKRNLLNFFPTFKELSKFGIKIVGIGSISEINNRLDIVMIGYFLNPIQIGYYAVSIATSKFILIVPSSIQTITYPATSSYWHEKNFLSLNKMLNKSIKYSTLILTSIGLINIFFLKNIILLLFSKDFFYSIIPFYILLLGEIVKGGLVQPIGGSLAAIGKPGIDLKITLGITLTNATLNFILIPKFGISGAAIATTTALMLGTISTLYFNIKYLSFKIDYKWLLYFCLYTISILFVFSMLFNYINTTLPKFILLGLNSIVLYTIFVEKEDKKMINSLFLSFLGGLNARISRLFLIK